MGFNRQRRHFAPRDVSFPIGAKNPPGALPGSIQAVSVAYALDGGLISGELSRATAEQMAQAMRQETGPAQATHSRY
jgi:hypothetical protein